MTKAVPVTVKKSVSGYALNLALKRKKNGFEKISKYFEIYILRLN